MEKFRAYVDGFSLYKGALEKRPQFKWLDLPNFCQKRMPDYELEKVFYFTARIKMRYKGDTSQHRQHKYFRVLKDQGIEIVEGKFLRDSDWLRQVAPDLATVIDPPLANVGGIALSEIQEVFANAEPDLPKSLVWKYGEKGSDVNLASYLLRDVYTGATQAALVISGDSDLATPIRISKELGKFIKTLHPRKGSGSEELRSASSKFEELHTTWLADSQLGRVFMTSKGGNIVRPEEWQ